ncbi:hypothetical protein KOAAANKH_03524 [Brevundimonas sp. NIBR10]|uniref:hypothetical protein n=1 Tax=Brevundimonas sp. NIBR10 TaxID=3015997 RepID=UPI0022F1D184|nr:hypothetical protein [Brevundimonas sp. NIBR10]WGM48621.1 hypothetical protein KOAAANKH_03524 [Brevundimonas sp. NIBR10]
MPLPLLAIAAATGSVLQGIGTIAGGLQSAKAAKASELGAKVERDMAMLRRTQIGEESRVQLATMLGNLAVTQSARGVSNDSQTSRLIERRTMADAYRAEAIAGLGELNRAGSASMAAKGFRTQAKWAIPLSVVNAAGSFAQAASYGSAMKRPGPPADLNGLY